MPTYEVQHPDGRTLSVEGPTPPTEADLDAIFAAAPPKPGFIERNAQTISNVARPALEAGGAVAGGLLAGGAAAPSVVGAVPAGVAGAGLGYAAGKSGADLLDRALGLKPKISSVGEAAKETGKNLVSGAASTLPLLAGGTVIKGALSSGTMTALMEANERGDVEPRDVVASIMFGGAIPLIAPTVGFVARVFKGTSKAAATAGTTLGTEAVDELAKDPKLLEKYAGTTEAVGERVSAIQKALIEQHDEAGAILDKARQKIGFREPFAKVAKRVQEEGFNPVDVKEIMEDYAVLSKDKIPLALVREAKKGTRLTGKLVMSSGTDSLGEQAMEYTKHIINVPEKVTTKMVELPTKIRLRDLVRLRENIDDKIRWGSSGRPDVPPISTKDQAFLLQLRKRVNGIIEKIPGGAEQRAADAVYSESRELYDEFQKALATQGKAEDVVRSIVKGGDVDSVIGRKGAFVRLLRQIEAIKKTSLVAPAQKEFAAREFRTLQQSKGSYIGALPAALGTGGVSRMLRGVNAATAPLESIETGPLTSPVFRGALQAAAAYSAKRQEPR